MMITVGGGTCINSNSSNRCVFHVVVSVAGGLPGVRLFPFGLDSHSGLCLWGSPCIDFGFTVDARE